MTLSHPASRRMATLVALAAVAAVAALAASAVGPVGRPSATPPEQLEAAVPALGVASAAPAAGELVGATDLAAAPDGSIYVLDETGRRVQRFGPDGEFRGMWSAPGRGEGLLAGPAALPRTSRIAVGPTGVVFLSDAGFGRIEKFTSSGLFYAQWRADVGDLAVAPDGTVFLTEVGSGRINNHCPAGRCLGVWGEARPGRCRAATTGHRNAIAALSDSTVVVAHHVTGEVELCTPEGDLKGSWRLPAADGSSWAGDIAAGPGGTLLVTGAGEDLSRFTSDGAALERWSFGERLGPPDVLRSAPVTVAPDGSIYLLVDRTRVVRLDAGGQVLGSWGHRGSGLGQMDAPRGIAVAPDGTVVVVEEGGARLQRFTAGGHVLDVWSGRGSGPGRLERPTGVAVGPDGRVLVADPAARRVAVFDPLGRHLADWYGDAGAGAAFQRPVAVAVGRDGDVYVVDEQAGRVVHLDAEGRVLGLLAGGVAENRLERPAALAVAGNGTVYVADARGAIVVLRADGGAGAWTAAGAVGGALVAPSAVAVASDGTLIVADAAGAGRVLRMTAGGEPAGEIEGAVQPGDGPVSLAALGEGVAIVGAACGCVRVVGEGGVEWGTDATGAGVLLDVVDLDVMPGGEIVAAEAVLDRLQIVSPDGGSLAQHDGEEAARRTGAAPPVGAAEPAWSGLATVDAAPDGDLVVTDRTGRVLRVSASSGAAGASWGGPTEYDGLPLAAPLRAVGAADGAVWVADGGHDRVLRLGADGRAEVVLRSGTGPARLDPVALDLSRDGALAVAARFEGRVALFDADGRRTGTWPPLASPPLVDVRDVAWTPREDLLVADRGAGVVYLVRGGAVVARVAAAGVRAVAADGDRLWLAGDAPGIAAHDLVDRPSRPVWRAAVFAGPWLAGPPSTVTTHDSLALDLGLGAPVDGLPPDGWSLRAERGLPAGVYDVRARAHGGLRVWVGDHLVVDEWWPPAGGATDVVSETARVDVLEPTVARVEYVDRSGPAVVEVDLSIVPGTGHPVVMPAVHR